MQLHLINVLDEQSTSPETTVKMTVFSFSYVIWHHMNIQHQNIKRMH